MDDLAIGAGELAKPLAGTFMAQHIVIHQGLVQEQDQLFGGAFALEGVQTKETPKPPSSQRTTLPSKRPKLST